MDTDWRHPVYNPFSVVQITPRLVYTLFVNFGMGVTYVRTYYKITYKSKSAIVPNRVKQGGKQRRRTSSALSGSLQKSRILPEVNLSAFAFLFSELVNYMHSRVTKVSDLERRLEEAGRGVGHRVLELVSYRERAGKRETRIIPMLQFVTGAAWKALFGKSADGLEKSTQSKSEYMINENEPITNKFISVPNDMGQLNCSAFVAGIIAGMLESAGFPAEVHAVAVALKDGTRRSRTVFVIDFEKHVIAREEVLAQYGK